MNVKMQFAIHDLCEKGGLVGYPVDGTADIPAIDCTVSDIARHWIHLCVSVCVSVRLH